MKPEEKFTRTCVGVLLIAAFFVSWGKWLSLVVGVLFLLSATYGYCMTCELYRKWDENRTKSP